MLQYYMNDEALLEFKNHYKNSEWWLKKNSFNKVNLCDWNDLSNIVSTYNFKHNDLVLAKSKMQFNPFSSNNKDYEFHKINVANIFSNYIRQGYTLILNSAHSWHPPISRFCSHLAQELNTFTQTNLYASWAYDEGAFGTHWDEHDVLIIQLDGRKNWKIFDKADTNPVSHKYSTGTSDVLLSEFTLEKGDILYIPMGQLHAVSMGNDISLHATVGIRRLTGLDVFEWLKDEVSKLSSFRGRIPSLNDTDELNVFMEDFLSNISSLKWNTSKDIISFEQYIKSKIDTRPYIGFPHIGFKSNNKEFFNKNFKINAFITYLGEHKVGLKVSDGTKKWVVPFGVSTSFIKLLSGSVVTYDSILYEGQSNGLDVPTIEKICSDMLDQGVVTFYN